jgi:hypothetical protein
MKSLLDTEPAPADKKQKSDEPATLVGSLAGGEAEVAGQEFEEDELELGGKLSELLAAVDNDFAEVEKREKAAKQKKPKKPPPPVGKPIAGVAEVPRAKSLVKPESKVWLADVEEKPATRVILDPDATTPPAKQQARPTASEASEGGNDSPKRVRIPRAPTLPPVPADAELLTTDEPTMRSIPFGEAALRPTMVGIPQEDEESGPIIISPPRTSSKAGDWVGAVVAAEPSKSQRNVSTVGRTVKEEIDRGLTIEDTMPFVEAATEGRIHTRDPRLQNGIMLVTTDQIVKDDGPTKPVSTDHIAPGRAREVFERLRKAGLKARSYSDDSLDRIADDDHPARRKDDKGARRFEQALVSLTAGDLELALAHFRALFDQMPNSKRVRAFIEAIESVREDQSFQPSILEDFEAALEDAIAYGRCPKCFSMMAPDEAECFACGFRLARTI